jgi:hypothetical protein
MGPKPNPRVNSQAHPSPSERRKRQASNADQVPPKRSRRNMKNDTDEGANMDEGEDEGADLGPWPEVEDRLVSKVKGKGIRGRGDQLKKAPTRRYVPKYQIPSFPAHLFPQEDCPGSKCRGCCSENTL